MTEHDDGSGYDEPPHWSRGAAVTLAVGVVLVLGLLMWFAPGMFQD